MYLLFWQGVMGQSVVAWLSLIEYWKKILWKPGSEYQEAVNGPIVGNETHIVVSSVILWPGGEKKQT
jgi:hypothetical protein